MLDSGWLGGHPESGALLSYADRGLSAPDHEVLAAHISECEYCQRELAVIESQARLISAAFATDSIAPVSDIRRANALKAVRTAARKVERRSTWRTVILPRLAAASIVAVAVTMVAGPGLALMRSVLGDRSPEPAILAGAVVTDTAAPGELPPSYQSWHWSSPRLDIEFENAGMGSVQFARQSGAFASVRVTGRAPGSGEGSAGDRVIITNTGSGSPSYVFAVPSNVREVTVRVAGGKQIAVDLTPGLRYDLGELSKGRNGVVRDR
jgi:hypothetical protein